MRFKTIDNQRGVAMLMAITTMLLLGILAAELVYDTEVYHRSVFNQLDELRAKTLAKSALKLAILQIQAKDKIITKAKGLGIAAASASDLGNSIWQSPLVLPPPVPSELGPMEKENLNNFNTALSLGGRIAIHISGESSKLNLNQLVWITPTTNTSTNTNTSTSTSTSTNTNVDTLLTTKTSFAAVLDQILQNKKQEDENFRNKYRNINGETLIQNILAWMSPSVREDGDRITKKDYYSRLSPNPYNLKDAPLFSMSELHMIKGIDEDIFQIISENFTTLVTSGINVNKAPISLIRGLIVGLTAEDGDKIEKRRTDPIQGGPFQNPAEFWTFINTLGDYQNTQQKLTDSGIFFTTDENTYRVNINASSGNSQKNWVAMVGPPPPPENTGNGTSTSTAISTAVSTSSSTNSNLPPTIIYLKAD